MDGVAIKLTAFTGIIGVIIWLPVLIRGWVKKEDSDE